MPFLHWFRKKSRSTEAEVEASSIDQSAPEPTTVAQKTSENSGQKAVPDSTSIEQQSASLPVMPLSTAAAPRQPAETTPGRVPTPLFSVPVGAFYAKLPPHLLVPERPEMARLIEIADEDVVFERETQVATVPLSILSLSCPDIFIRPVAGSDEIPITFSVNCEMPIAVAEPAEPLENATEGRASAEFNFSGPANSTEREIRLRLEPILSNFPADLEQPSIRNLSETKVEIVLPLDLIQSQLSQGRVVVSAAEFCRALPSDLRPCFETIEPAAEIPIPLREIFLRLPPEVIRIREDQEVDYPDTTIQTPFSEQAEEDGKRLSKVLETPISPGPMPEPLVSEIPVGIDSERLHAIFMTDEALDLPKTIRMVAGLPGLRACLLNTTDGLKLAGNLGDPGQEQAVSAIVSELFQQVRSKLASIRLGTLETITLYCGRDQLSTFMEGNFCLTVLHDNRPFKPGVREKVQAVIRELATLSTFEKQSNLSAHADHQLRQ